MATIINVNFKRKPLTGIKSGDTIEDCNCTQQNINTRVCKELTGLTVRNSNVRNCLFPTGTKFIGCKPYQKEIIPNIDPTPAEMANQELEQIKNQYGDVARTEAKKVFNLKEVL